MNPQSVHKTRTWRRRLRGGAAGPTRARAELCTHQIPLGTARRLGRRRAPTLRRGALQPCRRGKAALRCRLALTGGAAISRTGRLPCAGWTSSSRNGSGGAGRRRPRGSRGRRALRGARGLGPCRRRDCGRCGGRCCGRQDDPSTRAHAGPVGRLPLLNEIEIVEDFRRTAWRPRRRRWLRRRSRSRRGGLCAWPGAWALHVNVTRRICSDRGGGRTRGSSTPRHRRRRWAGGCPGVRILTA